MHHRMPPSETGWPSLNVVTFSTCDAPRPGRPKKVITPEIIDQIHELILEDRRISAKSVAEQLGISREWVGSITHEDLGMRELSVKWVPKCLNADEKRHRWQSSEQILEFFRRDPNDFLSRLVTMDETCLYHYSMTRRHSNNQWSGGIAAHPAPKYSECKNSLENISPRFFGIKTSSPSLIIFQRAKLSTRSITHPCWCNWRTFWRKNARRGKITKSVLYLHDNAPAHRALATRKKLAYLGFQCLDYPPYSPDLFPGLKKQLKGRQFSSDADVIAAPETWLDGQHSELFLSGLQKL